MHLHRLSLPGLGARRRGAVDDHACSMLAPSALDLYLWEHEAALVIVLRGSRGMAESLP
ncbi:MAG: hypothetical protein AAFT19_01285 [Pseudomonadota bacterium]